MNFLSVFSPEDTVIIQDDLHITAEEFQSISKKVAGYVSEKFQSDEIIGVKSDNSVYGLMLAVGASLAGKHVLPLSKMNDGQLNDYAIEETNCQSFIGYGTDLDHSDISKIENLPEFEPEQAPGDFIFLSSGSTGKPKIHLNNCINMDKQVSMDRADLFFSKAGIVDRSENTIFYAAPVMSAIGSYISFMALGMVPVYTAGRPSTEIIQSLIEKNNVKISTGRPSLIERFASQGITNLGSVDILVSSGSFITEENTEYITKNLGISRIVDTYNAAETGIMGIMDFLNDDSFTLIDDAEVVSVSDVDFEIKTASTSAIVVDKKIVKTETKTINDIVELDGRNLKLLGRSEDKIKVSGFSVSSEIVKEAFKQIPGIIDCRVKTGVKSKSSDSVIVEYLGQKYEEESLKNLMKEKLPSYSVPQSFVHKTFDNWGVLK